MLVELRDRLLAENRDYGIKNIWQNYRTLDEDGNVDDMASKSNVAVLTDLIQIVRYAYGKNKKLTSLLKGYAKQFSLYCGQMQRVMTQEQTEIMRQVADYIIRDGAISVTELNQVDTDLWRKAMTKIGKKELPVEIQKLPKFILKVA